MGRSSSKQILLLIIFVVILIGVFNIDRLFKLIEDFLPSRIGSVFDTDEGVFQSIISEFTRDRRPTILNSIETFFKNPFLGLALKGEIGLSKGYLAGFGQHSYIFDTLALYGALLGICNIIIIFLPFRFYKKNSVNALTIAIIVCMILLYFLNNATESIALAIGVMYPLVRESYKSSANSLMKV